MTTTRTKPPHQAEASKRKSLRTIEPSLRRKKASTRPTDGDQKRDQRSGGHVIASSAATPRTPREPNVDRNSLWMSEVVRLYIHDPDKFATDIVFDTTCDLIREGTLQRGDRVPSFQDLSIQLKIDTYSINLAYGRLQDEGILRAESRSGTFVASVAAVDNLAARTTFSQAILDCRKRGMSRSEINAIITAQLKRHFDETGRPDDERRPRSRKKA